MAGKTGAQTGFGELKQALREKNLGNFYIFYGEETYLLHYYLEQLSKKILSGPAAAFNAHRLNSESFSLEALQSSVEALPMMGERSFVHVDDVDIFRLSDGETERLADIFEDVPEYCCLVFTFETVEYKASSADKKKARLYEALRKNAQKVEFQKQSQRDLSAWVTRHFAAQGKSISADLCVYLIDITGGGMAALSGEIGKIAAFAPGGEITRRDIDTVTEPVLDAVVFQMTDAIGKGDYDLALRKLRDLLKMQQEPLAILGAVSGHLRRVSAARILMEKGRGADDLMRICGMKDYPARKTMSIAGKFSPAFCQKAAEWCMETDYQMKTSFDEPERLLELLILRLAQEQKT